MNNLAHCNHCVGKIVLSLNEHIVEKGLKFCSPDCAEGYFSPDNPEPYPVGLADELGLEEYA
jgi:hypothetical protein